MEARTVRVLHVDDDRIQRALTARHLRSIDGREFDIVGVDSEDQAVGAFCRGAFDLVLLDYQLSQGDGLNCLHQLRRIEPMVPIIAISGVATPEIASELIEAGADDYLAKQTMNKHTLGESVRNVLARAEAIRATIKAASKACPD